MMGHSVENDITNGVYGHRTLEELRAEIEKIKVPSLQMAVDVETKGSGLLYAVPAGKEEHPSHISVHPDKR